MEKPMDRTPARDAIADEAVGETLESRAPDAAKRAEIATCFALGYMTAALLLGRR